ncbi:MAG: SRPBCC domain-containing protein [Bacteroidota bacterium]
MKPNLQFDFLADKENNTLTITREFAANRQLVWDCYTKSELLDQWFAPKPFTTKTKSMDFREGGYWLYAMVEPNGTEYWGRMDYVSIQAIEKYTGLDAFCDSNGVLNPELPRANWDVTFKDLNAHALVQTIVTYQSLADLETVIQMGMKEGLTSTLERLDDLLITLNK